MLRTRSFNLSIASMLTQAIIFFVARREIGHSETLIYLFFFSIATTCLCAYISVKSKYESRRFQEVAIEGFKPACLGMLLGGMFAVICATSFYVSSDVVIDLGVFKNLEILKGFFLAFPAVIEEIVFRGLLLVLFCRALQSFGSISFVMANIAQAFLFSLSHFNTTQYGELFFPIQAFIIGIAFGYCALKQKSLWFPMGFHVAWNLSNSFLFGIHKKLLTEEPGLFFGLSNGAEFTGISILVLTLGLGSFLLLKLLKTRKLRTNI